jgi:hypothetical protein
VSGGAAPARAYIDELLPDILEGRIEPGRLFDRVVLLDDVPDGYRAIERARGDQGPDRVLNRPHDSQHEGGAPMTAWMSDELGKIGAAEEQSDISPRIHNSQDVQTAARGERLQSLLLPRWPTTGPQEHQQLDRRSFLCYVLPANHYKVGEPTSGLEPLTCSLRVCGQWLLVVAWDCKSRIGDGFSVPCIAHNYRV